MKRSRRRAKGRAKGPGAGAQRVVTLGPDAIEKMRAAGKFASELLDRVGEAVRPGVTTRDLDDLVAEATRARGARSAPYGYRGFPRHCCTSVNDVVCHGIPSREKVLREGDIVNVDVTPVVEGYHGDTSRTFPVGEISPVARRLVADTWKAMWLGIRAVRPGGRVGDVGHAIQSFAEAQGYQVVREFTGHGIHTVFHAPPTVLHYGSPGSGERLVPGMTFTVEPMINLGHWKTQILEDGWTAVTVDGTLSAQFEHTVLVTEEGVEVLTLGASETPPAAPS